MDPRLRLKAFFASSFLLLFTSPINPGDQSTSCLIPGTHRQHERKGSTTCPHQRIRPSRARLAFLFSAHCLINSVSFTVRIPSGLGPVAGYKYIHTVIRPCLPASADYRCIINPAGFVSENKGFHAKIINKK